MRSRSTTAAIGLSTGLAARAWRPRRDAASVRRCSPGWCRSTRAFKGRRACVLHRYGNDRDYRAWRESVLGAHGDLSFRTSQRNPTPLFGLGLVDAIPDDAIEAAARRRQAGWPGVHGRVSRLPDGRIGRFGWKAQTASLREFVLSAAAVELGLEVPGHAQAADPRIPPLAATGVDLNQDDCDAMIAYVRALPAPVAEKSAAARDERNGQGRQGPVQVGRLRRMPYAQARSDRRPLQRSLAPRDEP